MSKSPKGGATPTDPKSPKAGGSGVKHDNLGLASSRRVKALLDEKGDGDEVVRYSGRIVKVSSNGSWQLRALLITNKAVYNLLPSDVGKCKRRIPIGKVGKITVSKISTEMVIHVPEEYDLRFQSFYKDEIVQELSKAYSDAISKSLAVDSVWDFFLNSVARTKYDTPGGATIADDDDDASSMMSSTMESTGGKLDSMVTKSSPAAPTSPGGDELADTTDRIQSLLNKKHLASQEKAEDSDDEDETGKKIPAIQEEMKLEDVGDEKAISGYRPSGDPKKKVNMDSFDLLKVLGRGAFGKVMMVRKKDSGKIYAMKILKKHYVFAKKQVEHTKAERKILSAAQHPFLMGLRYAFQSESKLYLVLDFYKGGELFFHLQKVKKFSEEQAKIIGGQVCLALGHLHKHHFIYRDLKPENILMDEAGNVCLTDFGLSKEVTAENPLTKTMCGTPEYLPPEVLLGKEHGKAIDWWSFGVLMYELTVGIPPFMAKNHRDLYRKIQYAPIKFPKHTSEPLQNLILALLNREVDARLGAGPADVEDVKKHPFWKGLDWDRLFKKEIKPLYSPPATSGTSASYTENFAEEFLEEVPQDSVVPESMLSKLPEDERNFERWTFAASAAAGSALESSEDAIYAKRDKPDEPRYSLGD